MSGAVSDERWPEYADKARELLAHPDVARRATLLGSIARNDQIDLMLGAMGVLQPSRFEGWSTVVEEARALGLPSLLSEFAVHREQNPPGATFFDPDDADALAAMLDDWFAAPPEKQPLEAARERQAAHIQDCARNFLAVAAEAKRRYDLARHDPKPITAAALLELKSDLAEGRILPEDEALFQASARALFREHPEELARLGGYVGDEAYPLYPESMNLMIVASLAKMAPEARARFFAADLESAPQFAGKRDVLASPAGRISLGAIAAAAKTRDFVRRKLNR
jgi:hypothetical protein